MQTSGEIIKDGNDNSLLKCMFKELKSFNLNTFNSVPISNLVVKAFGSSK